MRHRRRRMRPVAFALAALAVGGGLASAQTSDTQTITLQVDASRSITLDTDAPIAPSLTPTDANQFAGGKVSYSTLNPGGDEIVVSLAADDGNPSDTGVALGVTAAGFTCIEGNLTPAGSVVDGAPETGTQPVTISSTATPVITAIQDTEACMESTASALLTYTVTTTAAAPGTYIFTVTYLLQAVPPPLP